MTRPSGPYSVSDHFLLTGTEHPLYKKQALKAGPVSVLYEAGCLQSLTLGHDKLLGMLGIVLRDMDWNVIAPVISSESIESGKNSFSVSCHVQYGNDPVLFSADIRYTGKNDGTIQCSLKGEILNTFWCNRMGFYLLHPVVESSGKNVKVIHPDGREEDSRFPETIAVDKPFSDIRSITYCPSERVSLDISFPDGSFETVDLRGWGDAFFGTYDGAIVRPLPAEFKKDTKVEQEIVLSVDVLNPLGKTKADEPVRITFSEEEVPFPSVGIAGSSMVQALDDAESILLRAVGFDHYRIDLHLADPAWPEIFTFSNTDARKLKLPLQIALYISQNPGDEVRTFLQKCFDIFPMVDDVIVLSEEAEATSAELFHEVEPLLREGLHHARIGVGTNRHFAALNRFKPYPLQADFLAWPVNPQMHFDDSSVLIKNLQAQVDIMTSASSFAEGRLLYVTPVSLKPQLLGTGIQDSSGNDKRFSSVDSRQMSLYAAGWTLGSFKYLAEHGATAITFFETIGERGIIQGSKPPVHPDAFPAFPGMVFPVYFLLRELLTMKEGKIIKSNVSDPEKISALLCSYGTQHKLFIANHTTETISVILPVKSQSLNITMLDLSSVRQNLILDKDSPLLQIQSVNLVKNILNLPPMACLFSDLPV
ncbi:MAG: hypothetical protein GYA43_13505 [Bacteroidales bacterium]|nr:hypothetical protein [Bacteroidales bacterium]